MINKYLTILSGNPRGGEKTWHSLYENVLNSLGSDLAICTGDKWLDNQSFLKVSNYQWIINEPEDWKNYYEEHFNGTWKNYFLKGEETGLYSSGLIHFALKDIINGKGSYTSIEKTNIGILFSLARDIEAVSIIFNSLLIT